MRGVARAIADAAEGAFEACRHRATDEPAITGQIVGAIGERVRGMRHRNVRWDAHILRGKAGEEREHGADLLAVLDIDVEGYQLSKGFLAQSKKAEPEVPLSAPEWERLRQQCNQMLLRTPASFVLVYSKVRGVRIFPAISILQSPTHDVFDLYDRSVADFFEAHIECFIGDRRLNAAQIETLDALVGLPVNHLLHLVVRSPMKHSICASKKSATLRS